MVIRKRTKKVPVLNERTKRGQRIGHRYKKSITRATMPFS